MVIFLTTPVLIFGVSLGWLSGCHQQLKSNGIMIFIKKMIYFWSKNDVFVQ